MAESLASNAFSGSCLVLITGASQGLGRSLAAGFAIVVGPGSVLTLSARNLAGLKRTVDLCKEARKNSARGGEIRFITVQADLTDQQQSLNLVQSCLSGLRSEDFERAILIHNAGSLGDISEEISDFEDFGAIDNHFNLNIAHLWPVTGQFLKWRLLDSSDAKTTIINVSSLLAVQAVPCFSQYCTAKAARDMFFKVLATEIPKLRVLNWAPGPLETAMSGVIRRTPNKHNTDKESQVWWQNISCERSTSKLLEVLCHDKFESGAHVDFYD